MLSFNTLFQVNISLKGESHMYFAKFGLIDNPKHAKTGQRVTFFNTLINSLKSRMES